MLGFQSVYELSFAGFRDQEKAPLLMKFLPKPLPLNCTGPSKYPEKVQALTGFKILIRWFAWINHLSEKVQGQTPQLL